MCGISGIYNLNTQPVDVDILSKMTKIIRHRGPDDEGFLLINTHSNYAKHCFGEDSIEEIKTKLFPLQNNFSANLAL